MPEADARGPRSRALRPAFRGPRPVSTVALLVFLVLAALPVVGAPTGRTPAALVQGSGYLAQVAEMGPVRLSYDVRGVGGSGVLVVVHRWPLKGPDAPPAAEWRFDTPTGKPVVSFDRLPIGIYRVLAVALGADGQAVAGPSYPVWVEYGGWRAWDGLNPDVDLRGEAPPLAGVGAVYVPREDQPGVSLSPATSLVKPGGEVQLRAVLRNLPPETRLEWELDGPGDLDPQEDGKATYTAPGESENQIVRVRAFTPDTVSEDGHSTLLVTPVQLEGEP